MSLTQSEVRQLFIRANPGVRLRGYDGYWYRCAFCGRWCGRPGKGYNAKNNPIPVDIRMEVDHITPWSKGGSDELYNLQPTCHACNRSKSNHDTVRDSISNTKNAILHPVDTFVKKPVRKAVRNNKVLKALGISSRK